MNKHPSPFAELGEFIAQTLFILGIIWACVAVPLKWLDHSFEENERVANEAYVSQMPKPQEQETYISPSDKAFIELTKHPPEGVEIETPTTAEEKPMNDRDYQEFLESLPPEVQEEMAHDEAEMQRYFAEMAQMAEQQAEFP